VAPMQTTTYVVTVTDSIGATASDTVTVTVGAGTSGQAGDGSETEPDTDGTDNTTGENDSTPGQSDGPQASPLSDSSTIGFPLCGAGVNSGMVLFGMLLLWAMRSWGPGGSYVTVRGFPTPQRGRGHSTCQGTGTRDIHPAR